MSPLRAQHRAQLRKLSLNFLRMNWHAVEQNLQISVFGDDAPRRHRPHPSFADSTLIIRGIDVVANEWRPESGFSHWAKPCFVSRHVSSRWLIDPNLPSKSENAKRPPPRRTAAKLDALKPETRNGSRHQLSGLIPGSGCKATDDHSPHRSRRFTPSMARASKK